MSSDYERTFSVSAPVDRAWRAFTEPEEMEAWFTTNFEADGSQQGGVADSPGGAVHFDLVEMREHSVLHYRQWAASPESGIDVTVVFESLENGTRITMTNAGFGGESVLRSDEVKNGMDETLADLVLYLDHGLRCPRHRDLASKAGLGADLAQRTEGVAIKALQPGLFSETIGLEPDDVLYKLGPSAVFRISDVGFFLRSHDVGDEVEVTWVRNGKLMHGRGVLTARDELTFAHRA